MYSHRVYKINFHSSTMIKIEGNMSSSTMEVEVTIGV